VTYSDFLVSGMADSAENLRPKMAVFSANSSDAKPKGRVRFNKNRDFDDIGNGKVNKEVT
jgi:hypothetical protein